MELGGSDPSSLDDADLDTAVQVRGFGIHRIACLQLRERPEAGQERVGMLSGTMKRWPRYRFGPVFFTRPTP